MVDEAYETVVGRTVQPDDGGDRLVRSSEYQDAGPFVFLLQLVVERVIHDNHHQSYAYEQAEREECVEDYDYQHQGVEHPGERENRGHDQALAERCGEEGQKVLDSKVADYNSESLEENEQKRGRENGRCQICYEESEAVETGIHCKLDSEDGDNGCECRYENITGKDYLAAKIIVPEVFQSIEFVFHKRGLILMSF